MCVEKSKVIITEMVCFKSCGIISCSKHKRPIEQCPVTDNLFSIEKTTARQIEAVGLRFLMENIVLHHFNGTNTKGQGFGKLLAVVFWGEEILSATDK